jgi:hypothetical protein
MSVQDPEVKTVGGNPATSKAEFQTDAPGAPIQSYFTTINGCGCLPCGQNSLHIYQDRVEVETSRSIFNIHNCLFCWNINLTHFYFRDTYEVTTANCACNAMALQSQMYDCSCCCYQCPCCLPKMLTISSNREAATYLDTSVENINQASRYVLALQKGYKLEGSPIPPLMN